MRPKWDQRRVHCIVHDSLDVVEIDISDEALPNSSQLVQAMLAENMPNSTYCNPNLPADRLIIDVYIEIYPI